MAGMWMAVPDVLWLLIEPLIPVPQRRFRYPGRKRFSERSCLEGILTVLRSGIPWDQLPREPGRPSGQTCWRRLDEWQKAGVWPLLVEQLQQQLARADLICWERAIIDSTIVPAKKGAAKSARILPIAAVQPRSSI
jgi:transposase